jgi:hypothetical protein
MGCFQKPKMRETAGAPFVTAKFEENLIQIACVEYYLAVFRHAVAA